MFSPPKIRGTPITPMRLVAINQRNFRNANMVRQSVPRDSFQGDVEDVPRTSLRSGAQSSHTCTLSSLVLFPIEEKCAPYPLLSLFAYKVFTCHLAQRPGSSFNYGSPSSACTRLRYPTGRSSRIVISRNPRGNSIEGWKVVLFDRLSRSAAAQPTRFEHGWRRFDPWARKKTYLFN